MGLTIGPFPRISQPAPDAAIRSQFIGGSEISDALGVSHFGRGCPRALAYEKTQTPKDIIAEDAESVGNKQRGNLLEPTFIKLYCEQSGRKVLHRKGIKWHPSVPGWAVHIDGFIVADGLRPTGTFEQKTCHEGHFYHIKRNGPPEAYIHQLQYNLGATGHEWGSLAFGSVSAGLDVAYVDFERDEKLIAMYGEVVTDFWETINANRLPPKLEDPHDIRCRLCPFRFTCRGEEVDPEEYREFLQERDRKKPLVKINNAELAEALADRELILSEREALDSKSAKNPGALQTVTARILELVGDQEAVIVNGRFKVYSSENVWSGLDFEKLKSKYPDAYKDCRIDQRPTGRRKLRVYTVSQKGGNEDGTHG